MLHSPFSAGPTWRIAKAKILWERSHLIASAMAMTRNCGRYGLPGPFVGDADSGQRMQGPVWGNVKERIQEMRNSDLVWTKGVWQARYYKGVVSLRTGEARNDWMRVVTTLEMRAWVSSDPQGSNP